MDLPVHPLYILMPLGSFLAILGGIAVGRVTEEFRREMAAREAAEEGIEEEGCGCRCDGPRAGRR